jgi:leucine dehydrogenase
MSLSAQMTRKVAFAELPCGGGKSVILDHPGLDRRRALEAFGKAVESLDGGYFCGPDVGTGPDDLAIIRSQTDYVNDVKNDASVATARGVLAGLRATLTHCPSAGPLSAVIQGVGNVGRLVVDGVEPISQGSAAIYAADPDHSALSLLPEDITRIAVHASLTTPAHILIPCALGPVVTQANIASLPFAAICGSANTQLESDELAIALMKRRVLYAPDFVVNAGAVIEGVTVLFSRVRNSREDAGLAIDQIEQRLSDVFEESEATGRTPLEIALSRANR